jgi:hypothetical protein
MFGWFLAVLVVVMVFSILVFILPLYVKPITADSVGPWNLNAPQLTDDSNIRATVAKTFLQNQKSTLRVFYYVKSIPRTGAILDSSAPGFNTSTNTFDICDNASGACVHPGFTTLLKFGSSLYIELLQAPDASRPGLPKTQLCVTTRTPTGTTYLETFALPPFPLQKWVMLTISRQGSHFEVYYNGRLAGSIKTTNVPYLSATDVSLADSNVTGEASHLRALNVSSTAQEVSSDFTGNTDTRGEPIQPIFSQINFTLCPSGECFSGPKVRPSNPLVVWTSNYS